MTVHKKDYDEVKRTIAAILREFNLFSDKDFASMDEETGAVLYENLKAGVLEEYNVSEDEISDILDEVVASISKQ